MDERISKELADKAERTDEGSVLKKSRLKQYIRNRFDTEDETKRAIATSKYQKGSISRRDFLKMLGLAGTGVIATTIGYGILPEQGTRVITGRPTGGNCNYDTIQVPSGTMETFSDPQKVSNAIIDITSSNSGINIDIHGDNYTIENLGVRGEQNQSDRGYVIQYRTPSSSSRVKIRNVYLGDGSAGESNKGGMFAGPSHSGIAEIENVYVGHMHDNGLYATDPAQPYTGSQPGITNVRNSYFDHNKVCNIRVPGDEHRGEGSVVENCHVECGDSWCGIRAEFGTITVRNCEVAAGDNRILEDVRGGDFNVENTRCDNPGLNNFCNDGPANPQPPAGVPMSPEEAACGVSTAGGGGKITHPSVDEWTSITLTGGSSSDPAEYIIKADELRERNVGEIGQMFGNTATGSLTGNAHRYEYRGRLLDLTAEEGISVRRAGEELSQNQLLNLICG